MHFHLTKPSFSFSFSFPSMGAFRLSKSVVSKYKCIDKDIPIAPPLPRPISKSPINQHRKEQKQGQEVEELNELNLREKLLYLESIGVDSYRAVGENSQISTTGLESIESVVKLLQSMGIDKNDIGRLAGMCPEELILSTRQLRGVFTFLLREAKIPLRNIKRIPIGWLRGRLRGKCSLRESLLDSSFETWERYGNHPSTSAIPTSPGGEILQGILLVKAKVPTQPLGGLTACSPLLVNRDQVERKFFQQRA